MAKKMQDVLIQHDFGNGEIEVLESALDMLKFIMNIKQNVDWNSIAKKAIYSSIRDDVYAGKASMAMKNACTLLDGLFKLKSEVRGIDVDRKEFSMVLVASFGFDIEKTVQYIIDHEEEFVIVAEPPKPVMIDVEKDKKIAEERKQEDDDRNT